VKFGLNRATITFVGFLLIAGYFLWAEHAAHIMLAIPYLPFLLLLLCPLMHVFMHGGHGHGGHRQDRADAESGTEAETQHGPTGHSPLPITRHRDE